MKISARNQIKGTVKTVKEGAVNAVVVICRGNHNPITADITLRLKNVLEPRLKELGVEELFWNIEMPLVRVLADMELNGVCLEFPYTVGYGATECGPIICYRDWKTFKQGSCGQDFTWYVLFKTLVN